MDSPTQPEMPTWLTTLLVVLALLALAAMIAFFGTASGEPLQWHVQNGALYDAEGHALLP